MLKAAHFLASMLYLVILSCVLKCRGFFWLVVLLWYFSMKTVEVIMSGFLMPSGSLHEDHRDSLVQLIWMLSDITGTDFRAQKMKNAVF